VRMGTRWLTSDKIAAYSPIMLSKQAALGLMVLVVLTGCRARADAEAATPRPVLRISMRPTDILSAFLELPQFSAQAVPIGDAQKRLEALENGSVDVASAVADVTYAAFYGRLPGHSAPLQKIRGIALMNRAVVHLLIGPKVDPSHGLRGLRIVLGDPVGGNSPLGERLVNSTGVATSAIRGEFVPYDIAADRLLKAEVDALIATVQPPHESIARALAGGARLLEIQGPEVDRLRVHYPLLRRTLLPRGTYPGQDAPLHTVGVDLLLVCRADLDTQLVYEITRALLEDIPKRVLRQVDPHRAPATVIPLHAGAARYYREREMQR
jgi:TRAP transporter TAXI family solute receptor